MKNQNIPTEDQCQALLEQTQLPLKIQKHCQAVVQVTKELLQWPQVKAAGLSEDLVVAAAYLHDVKRLEEEHDVAGALFLEELGYSEVAQVVAVHMTLPEEEAHTISEKSLVYLADKLVREDIRVSLEERFLAKEHILANERARENCQRRYERAKKLYDLMNIKENT